jgi:4-hydroxy-3-polyprenylbenzoate decarboxylase
MSIKKIDDLRDFLEVLDEMGELNHVTDEINWRLEMTGIGAMSNRVDDKIPLFENIKGYPKGVRATTDPYRGSHGALWRRIALSIGLSPDISYEDYINEYIDRFEHPVRPIVVDKGSCQEVVLTGKDADVLKTLPVPYIHDGDGGRYLTMHAMIVKDPDSEWVNWANYRALANTGKKISFLFCPGQQNPNLYYYKYEARNQPMPVAIAIGGHPAVWYMATTPLPAGVSEVDFIGGMIKKPVELVKCVTNDLYVPANSEFVIEGVMMPHERVDEGPFGEYLGYMHGPRRPMPFVRVQAITHRKKPILPICVEGTGVGESNNVCNSSFNALLTPALMVFLKQLNYPVKFVIGPELNAWSCLIAATKIPYPGYAKELGELLLTCPGPSMYYDLVFILDEDVDITNMETVWEEIVTKAHPTKDWHNFGDAEAPRSTLNIYQTAEEKSALDKPTTKAKTSKCWIDATTKDWDEAKNGPKRMEFDLLYQGSKEWVAKNRGRYGLPAYQDFREEGIRWTEHKYYK